MKNKGYYTAMRNEMLEFIPNDAYTFLDIGCGDGNFGKGLKAISNGGVVWGAEIVPEIASSAELLLDKVIVGDICKNLEQLPNDFFDCITFNDSLEHMQDPYTLLQKLKSKLSKNGVIVSSIPNIRHYKVLKSLIFDKDWEYTEAGTLDRTHLRFFTRKSIIRMYEEQGYEVELIEGINKTKRGKMKKLNWLTFGWLEDTLYLQFASRVRPKK